MTITRRSFLTRVAAAGGYAAVYSAMQALGMFPIAAQASTLPTLPNTFGTGKSVVILGAGIAGLSSAYELRKAGFAVTVLEAANRPGGRNFCARNGVKFTMTDGYEQECTWEEGHYQNCGPARIPSIHRNLLGYCQTLGVELEVEINVSRSALMQADTLNGGQAVTQRRVVHDTRGYLAELLAKAIDRHTLDDVLTAEDGVRLRDFLKAYGDLDAGYAYKGTSRAGYRVPRAAGPTMPELYSPLSLHDLLVANFTTGELYEEQIDWQATMFQPVGGMDRIPYAFARELGDIVQYESPVTDIRNTSQGVRVAYTQGGTAKRIDADYCICTLPVPLLRTLPSNFSAATKAAFGIPMMPLYKIAWEAPRFWEKKANIYGGISFLNQPVDLVWYPSAKLFSETGIILSGFNVEGMEGYQTAFDRLTSVEAKLAASRMSVEKLHPGDGDKLTKPIYVSWGKMPWARGALADTHGPATKPAYDQLNQGDGRVYFAGDYLTYGLTGWQEGAILSAHRSIELIAGRMRAA